MIADLGLGAGLGVAGELAPQGAVGAELQQHPGAGRGDRRAIPVLLPDGDRLRLLGRDVHVAQGAIGVGVAELTGVIRVAVERVRIADGLDQTAAGRLLPVLEAGHQVQLAVLDAVQMITGGGEPAVAVRVRILRAGIGVVQPALLDLAGLVFVPQLAEPTGIVGDVEIGAVLGGGVSGDGFGQLVGEAMDLAPVVVVGPRGGRVGDGGVPELGAALAVGSQLKQPHRLLAGRRAGTAVEPFGPLDQGQRGALRRVVAIGVGGPLDLLGDLARSPAGIRRRDLDRPGRAVRWVALQEIVDRLPRVAGVHPALIRPLLQDADRRVVTAIKIIDMGLDPGRLEGGQPDLVRGPRGIEHLLHDHEQLVVGLCRDGTTQSGRLDRCRRTGAVRIGRGEPGAGSDHGYGERQPAEGEGRPAQPGGRFHVEVLSEVRRETRAPRHRCG